MKRGFTLIELLAVIVILAVIASITLVSVKNLISYSRKSLSKTQIANIEEAAKNPIKTAYKIKEDIKNKFGFTVNVGIGNNSNI